MRHSVLFLLTLVFISVSIVPLCIKEAVVLILVLDALKVQIFLQDCLLTTLLMEQEKKILSRSQTLTTNLRLTDLNIGDGPISVFKKNRFAKYSDFNTLK